MCSKQPTKAIEYFGVGDRDKRKYALSSLLKYYNPTYLTKKYKKKVTSYDTALKLVTDIKNNLQIETPQQWNNTPGLNLIDLRKLNDYSAEMIIKKLAQWSSNTKKNKNNPKIFIRSHPKFTNVDGFFIEYHKTTPKHIKQKEFDKQQKNNLICKNNSYLEQENNYLRLALENEKKRNRK